MKEDEDFLEMLNKVCEGFGYKIGREVVVNVPYRIFVVNDPEISKKKRHELAIAIGEAVEEYKRVH